MFEDVDRGEWDRLWSARTLHQLPGECKLDASLTNPWSVQTLNTTIAADPVEYAARCTRITETCPVCGDSTTGSIRVGASLYVTNESGMTLGYGVWVHLSCFEMCPDTGISAGVPW